MMYRLAVVALLLAAIGPMPAFAQKSKDTLRYPIPAGESMLDPYLNPGLFNETWEGSVFDNLLGFDPVKSEFVPLLAKNWNQPDPTTYDFTLREDVKWHDGQPFDADDVVYTIRYLTDPKVNLRYKTNWSWVKSVEKLGKYQLRITSKEPAPDAMQWMVSGTSIYPKHVHEPLADKQPFGQAPVGTGPLKIAKIDKNSGIIAEKNPYFASTRAKQASGVGRVVAEVVPDVGTMVAKLMTGEIDLARNLPADQAIALRDTGRFELTMAPPNLANSFIGFPTAGWSNVKALGDERVRLAIVKAIDRKALLQAKYGTLSSYVELTDGLCLKEQLGCGFTRKVPDYDPAGAKKLLAEAGYGDGFDVTISTFPNAVAEVTAAAGMLRQVGIRASVFQHPAAQRVQLLSAGKVDIGYYTWSGGGMFDVAPQIGRYFLSNEYADDQLVKLSVATGTIMNDRERRVAAAAAFDYAADRAYAFNMLQARGAFTHTKEVRLDAVAMQATEITPHNFSWK